MPEADPMMAVMFADISGSTTLYEKHGDAQARKMTKESIDVLTREIDRAHGRLIKTIGDEVMATFPSADAAFKAACAMQDAHATGSLSIRVGFHWGAVIEENDDVFGDTVNVAARMAALAAGGEIMTTAETVQALSSAHRSSTRMLNTTNVKGKDEPTTVFNVIWQDDDDDLTITTAGMETGAGPAKNNHALVLRHGGAELRFESGAEAIMIGRSTKNDFVVAANLASRQHAKIEFSRGKFLITDRSTNGTFLVSASGQVTELRRETGELAGKGMIGLGAKPEDGSPEVVLFERLA